MIDPREIERLVELSEKGKSDQYALNELRLDLVVWFRANSAALLELVAADQFIPKVYRNCEKHTGLGIWITGTAAPYVPRTVCPHCEKEADAKLREGK